MTSKYSSQSRGLSRLLISALLLILMILTPLVRAQEKSKSEHFMSRSVRNISPEQAVEYIAQTKLATASRIPNTQTILVTADASALAKARTLLELVDSKQPYLITLLPYDQNIISAIEQGKITELLTDLSLGDFNILPATGDKPRALVDTHDNTIIVAAPANQMEHVLSALEYVSVPSSTAPPIDSNQLATGKTEPTDSIKKSDMEKLQNDRFFNQALESLMQAEKAEAKLRRTQETEMTEPSEFLPEPTTGKTEPADEQPDETKQAESMPESGQTKIVELGSKDIKPTIEKISYEPIQTEFAEEQLELDLPETINVVELIDLVGKHLNLDLLYDPKEVTGQVTLRVQDKIKVGELYPLLESVLKFRGFAMSRKGNLVTIVPIAKALETDPVLFDSEKQDIQYGNVIVTRVYDLRFINTSSAENLLKEMKLGAHIKGVDEAGKLIVTDYAYRMNRVDELLRIIDRPGELKQFRYRQLRYTMAASLAEQVETLAEQLGTVSITVSAEEPQEIKRRRGESTAAFRRRQQQARSSAAKTSGQPTGQPMVYLDADERTNRILMIGMPEQLDIVETLIDSLDVAQQDLRTLRLYDIQYAGAEEVMQKLQDLGIITASKRTTQQSGRITAPQRGQKPAAAQETSAPTVLTEEGLVEEPQIVIIESTNSLLVNATAEQHAQIATIIAYVDAEPEQAALNYVVYPLENQDPEELATVLNQLVKETIEETTSGPDSKVVKTTSQRRIEDDITIIAEPSTYSLVVYANKKHQQWINAIIEQLDQYRPQVLLDVTLVSITKNDDFNYSLNLLTKYPTLSGVAQITGETSSIFDKRFWEAQSDSGSGSFFYNDDHVQALLTAVQTRNWGRVLSSPKLLVNDNQEGIIKQERTIYITETNVTTTTTTTTPTTNTDVKFAPYTTGIDLTIKPHISKGNQLRLEIKLVRDDFEGAPQTVTVGGSSYEKPPNERSNDINSVVTVPDGYTVILGGIEQLSQSKGGSKVPLLGDIPIIGGIFNSINNSDEQSRLYIFVKAHILRPSYTVGDDTDIVKVSQKMRAKFEKLEEDFQKSQDWPGIDPEPLDPLKSLEAD